MKSSRAKDLLRLSALSTALAFLEVSAPDLSEKAALRSTLCDLFLKAFFSCAGDVLEKKVSSFSDLSDEEIRALAHCMEVRGPFFAYLLVKWIDKLREKARSDCEIPCELVVDAVIRGRKESFDELSGKMEELFRVLGKERA